MLPSPAVDLSTAAVENWPGWGGEECPVCGAFTDEGASLAPRRCPRCADSLPPFRAARSLFPYEGAAGEAIRAIKYGGAPAPAAAIADRLLADGIRGRWADIFPAGCRFCVVPVPIRPLKYLRRGFNLPTLVGDALARRAGWQCAPALLERVCETRPQAGLRVSGRQANVAGAFRVARRVREAPEAVLLLDDVYTTGATAEACAHALKRAGSQLIVVLTIARAVRTNPHAPESR